MVFIKRKIILILVSFLLVFSLLIGTSVANLHDHNHNTHGEDDGNYEEHNNNPYDETNFPGDGARQRSGVEW